MRNVDEIINGDSFYFHVTDLDENGKIVNEFDIDFDIVDTVGPSGYHRVTFNTKEGVIQNFGTRMLRLSSDHKPKKADIIMKGNRLKDLYAFSIIYDRLTFDFDRDTFYDFLVFLRGDSTADVHVNMRPRTYDDYAIMFKMFNEYQFPPKGSIYAKWREQDDWMTDYKMRFGGRDDEYSRGKVAFYESDLFQPNDYIGLIRMGCAVCTSVAEDYYFAGNTALFRFWMNYPFFKNHFRYPAELHPDQDKEPYEVFPYISKVEYGKVLVEMDKKNDAVGKLMVYLLFRGYCINVLAGLTVEDVTAVDKETGRRRIVICNHSSDKGFQKKKKNDMVLQKYDKSSFTGVDVEDMLLIRDLDEEGVKLVDECIASLKARGWFTDAVRAATHYDHDNHYLFLAAKDKLHSAASWTKSLTAYVKSAGIPLDIPGFPNYDISLRFRNGYVMQTMYFSEDYLKEEHRFIDPKNVECRMTPFLQLGGGEYRLSRFNYRDAKESFPEMFLYHSYLARRASLKLMD